MSDKIRVLLVDDEERFVVNLTRILTGRGFDVSQALNGHDALGMVKYGGGFDVVVLDVKMPGMDGIETLGEIKKWAPDTEVIMLTAYATLSSGTEAMRKGAYDYMMKPCDIEELVEKIREAHEAEVIKRHPVLWPRKMVRDIPLHKGVGLLPEDSLGKALAMMRREPGEFADEEVYILDTEDRLLGVVTRRQLLNQAQRGCEESSVTWIKLQENPHWIPDKPLKELMSPDPVTTQSNALLTDAANQMIMHGIRRLPVIRVGKLVGIIRMQDIFQYLEGEIE